MESPQPIFHKEAYVIRRVCFGVFAPLLLLLLVPSGMRAAEGTSCSFPTVVVPDGRVEESTIPASTTFFFVFTATPGHSYSIEFKNKVDQWGTLPGTMSVYYTNFCSTPDGTTDTTIVDPKIETTANRVSFTMVTGGVANRVWIKIARIVRRALSLTHSLSPIRHSSARAGARGSAPNPVESEWRIFSEIDSMVNFPAASRTAPGIVY